MMPTLPNPQIFPYFPFQLHKQAQISLDASLPGETFSKEPYRHMGNPIDR